MVEIDIERALKIELGEDLEEDLYFTYHDDPDAAQKVKFVKKVMAR